MQQDKSIRRIAAHMVLTPRGFLRDGMITLDGCGTVTEVSAPGNLNSLSNVEFYSGIIIPGLVNAHTHLELSYLRGAIPERSGFAGFAASLREHRGRFSDKEIAETIDYWDVKMYSDGVQAVGDICNGSSTFRAKQKSKIAYSSFIELFGLNLGPERVQRAYELRTQAVESGLCANITPHSTYSLNEEGFKLALCGSENSRLSIHFMESPGESGLYRSEGEIYEWYQKEGMRTDFTVRYASPAERIVKMVPADREIMLVHNTMIGERELEMLGDHFGSNLTLVVCPLSNRFITGLVPPFSLLEKSGARIAIGTDSLASNHTISLIEELKTIKGVPLEAMLRWATVNGAQALGEEDSLGSIEPGKRPGIVLLTGINWENMSLAENATTRRLA